MTPVFSTNSPDVKRVRETKAIVLAMICTIPMLAQCRNPPQFQLYISSTIVSSPSCSSFQSAVAGKPYSWKHWCFISVSLQMPPILCSRAKIMHQPIVVEQRGILQKNRYTQLQHHTQLRNFNITL